MKMSKLRRYLRCTLVAALLLAGAERLPAPISEVENPTPTPTQSAKPKLESSPRPKMHIKAATEGRTAFDGSWAVTVDGKAFKNGDGSIAEPWTVNFTASVKDGVFHGEYGVRGKPFWFELIGNIAADGTAALVVNELTGEQKHNFSTSKKPPPGNGARYSYQVGAHFDGKHGTGHSTSDARTRIFTFFKES